LCPGGDEAVQLSVWRARTFVYDSLSRLTSATNPESGSTLYSYDANGNLISKTDARGVTVNYNPAESPIDALNRVTKKTYSTGDLPVSYFYDQSSYNGVTIANGIGRRSGMSDVTCSPFSVRNHIRFRADSGEQVRTTRDGPSRNMLARWTRGPFSCTPTTWVQPRW